MKDKYFVNIAIDEAIKNYIASSKNPDSLMYNSFLVVVIRILSLIYGRLDILNPYYLKNSVTFFNNLAKFGMSKTDLALLKEELLNFYNFDSENQKRTIKEINPYFISTLKYLIDMFILKKRVKEVDISEEEEFLELIYTTHTKNPYRISYAYFNGNEALYLEKYYYSKLNEFDTTKEFNKTISTNLNLEALNFVGVSLSDLKNMSTQELENAKNRAYNYFEVDASSINRETDLQEKVNYYKMYGSKKVSTGNGYVDILLLMSIIATTLSVMAIIFFSLI